MMNVMTGIGKYTI